MNRFLCFCIGHVECWKDVMAEELFMSAKKQIWNENLESKYLEVDGVY